MKSIWSLRWSTAWGWRWSRERTCMPSEELAWLEVYKKDEPEILFILAEKQPKKVETTNENRGTIHGLYPCP